MSASSLFVLIIRDVGLRSSLSARLELSGASVVSAREFRDPALDRRKSRPRAILVLDEDVVADEPSDWLEALQDEAHWSRIVVLIGEHPESPGPDDRLVYIERRTAPQQLAQLLPQWRARDAG